MPEEALILSKDGQIISAPLKKKLPQHQLDGIRFLYRQFKLKQSGAILNDPTGYGKRLQVCLFINAIAPLLTSKKILLLCNECDIDKWVEQFQQWTDCHDEVVSNSATPITKHTIFINPLKDCLTFGRRPWGVVVVSSDSPSKEVLRCNIRADYKIWVSHDDVKENLQSFVSIYKWICPDNTFDIKEFTPTNNSLQEVINRKILLDAYMEDIVIRRTDFSELFYVPQKPTSTAQSPRKPVKNKDPTGLKVKRSRKRKIDENAKRSNNIRAIFQSNFEHNELSTPNEFDFVAKSNDENKLDLDCDIIGDLNDNNGFIKANRLRKRERIDSDSESMDFATAINDIVLNENSVDGTGDFENDNIVENTIGLTEHLQTCEENNDFGNQNMKLIDTKNENSQNNRNVTEDFQTCKEVIIPETERKDLNIETTDNTDEKSKITKHKNLNENHVFKNYEIEVLYEINEAKSSNHALLTNPGNKKSLTNDKTNEINDDLKQNVSKNYGILSKTNDVSQNKDVTSQYPCEVSKNCDTSSKNDVNLSKNNDTSSKNKNESSNKPRSVLSSLKDVDDRLLEYENQAMARYKGSLLDKLF